MKKRRRPARPPQPVKEEGAIVKRGRGLTKVALVYPNTYKAGMSSLGFQTVYRLANQDRRIACERVFLPDTRKKSPGHAPQKGSEKILSLETGLPLDQFDMILFSISFENDFLNLARILRASGIPLRSSDRNHIHPLVAAGGVACFLNPEPIAPFMDLFLLGEAECLLPPFFDLFHRAGQKKDSRTALLEQIEGQMAGAYVPDNHAPILYPDPDLPIDQGPGCSENSGSVHVQYIGDLSQTRTTTAVMTSNTAFKDTFLIETLKGCPNGCRFCTAGFIYRPPRVYPKDTILSAMDEAAQKTDRVGLVSSAVLDHPDIKAICRYGRNQGLTLSFSSLRADKLDKEIIAGLAESHVKTATIAPEAGSHRMRQIINKKLTRRQILDAAQSLVDQGIINLRLYFMIGLPFETPEDVSAIVDLTRDIKAVFLAASRKKKKIGTITLSINPFIPKPATPFQWSAMTAESELKKRVDIIRHGLKKEPNVALNFESLRQARIHALLSLGDRKAADLIELALEQGWTRALKSAPGYCRQVIYTEKTRLAPGSLPWDVLRHRVSDSFLRKELARAEKEKHSVSCPMKPCRDCRICMADPGQAPE
ncbi:MAG: radical SAM protein [Desulfobacter sp.]|nr:MAG: radical SAM protein [Desulfobacter sp.]